MKVVVWCKDCDAQMRLPPGEWRALRCPECGREQPVSPTEALRAGTLDACCVCGYAHFHVRKDFPRVLGLAIVGAAAVLTFTPVVPRELFFLPLILASAVDLVLYQLIPWKAVCYVCEAEYPGYPVPEGVKPFDLHEATEHKRLKWPKPASL